MSGDRIKLAHGTKKLKKLFLEARVPVRERSRIPVLSDREGRVLWVGGLASSRLLQATPPDFFLGIRNVDEP